MIETSVPCGRAEELQRQIENSGIPYRVIVERKQPGTNVLIKLACTLEGRDKDTARARSVAARQVLVLLDAFQRMPSLQ